LWVKVSFRRGRLKARTLRFQQRLCCAYIVSTVLAALCLSKRESSASETPKESGFLTLLEQSGITGEVELEIEDNKIIIHAAESPRRGWEEAFAAMAQHGDDVLIDPDAESDWDHEEWQW